MGGNALTQLGVTARRLSRDEFARVVARIAEALHDIHHVVKPELASKETFGDVDVYMPLRDDWRDIIMARFSPRAIRVNGKHLLSFDFEEYQIDFNPVENEAFATFFHAYGMPGVLFCKLLHAYNLRLTSEGLFLKYNAPALRDDGGVAFEPSANKARGGFLLSSDVGAVSAFLGIDFTLAPPHSAKDVYRLVCASRWFDPRPFLAWWSEGSERMNPAIREGVDEFAQYIRAHLASEGKGEDEMRSLCAFTTRELVRDASGEALEYFGKRGEFEEHVKRDLESERVAKERRGKFSGTLFIRHGFSADASLPHAMRAFKALHHCEGAPALDAWVDARTEEEVEREIAAYALACVKCAQ